MQPQNLRGGFRMSNSLENVLKSLFALAWLIMKTLSNEEVVLENVRIEEVSFPKKWCFEWSVYLFVGKYV